jgi:hypothetical protein
MYNTEISKEMLALHKNASKNALEFMRLNRKAAEKVNDFWMNSLNISPEVCARVEQWRSVAKNGREGFKKVMQHSYDNWEAYLDRQGNHKP